MNYFKFKCIFYFVEFILIYWKLTITINLQLWNIFVVRSNVMHMIKSINCSLNLFNLTVKLERVN